MSVTYDVETYHLDYSDEDVFFSIDETDSNLVNLSITNTQTNNFQTGVVTISNHPSSSTITIGDRFDISINDDLVFQGNVANIRTTMEGVRVDQFELVGLTFLLWQYTTHFGYKVQ